MKQEPEREHSLWRSVVGDFAHNTLFAFLVGPFINGISSAINRKGFWYGFKEVATCVRGWKCNAELALVIGVIATSVNYFLGRNTPKPLPSDAREEPAPERITAANPASDHAKREDIRRQQQPTEASITH